MLSRKEILCMKEKYPRDTPIQLVSMAGETQMPSGMKGKVLFVDDIGQIHTQWENGSTLALNVEEDTFIVIGEESTPEQEDKEQEFGELFKMSGPT